MRLGWISLLALWPAVAVGISGKGYLEDRYQYRTNDQPGQPESLGHRWEGRLEGRWWKDNWSLDGMVLGRFRSQYRDVGGRVENELEQDLKFHELYGTWMSPDWQVRLGRQQVAWGRGDYFRLVDVINPWTCESSCCPTWTITPWADSPGIWRSLTTMATPLNTNWCLCRTSGLPAWLRLAAISHWRACPANPCLWMCPTPWTWVGGAGPLSGH